MRRSSSASRTRSGSVQPELSTTPTVTSMRTRGEPGKVCWPGTPEEWLVSYAWVAAYVAALQDAPSTAAMHAAVLTWAVDAGVSLTHRALFTDVYGTISAGVVPRGGARGWRARVHSGRVEP